MYRISVISESRINSHSQTAYIVLLLIASALSCGVAADEALKDSKEVTGVVIKVEDGDTLTMLIDQRPVNIRLAEIDAPERGQRFYRASGESLRTLCAGQQAAFRQTDLDRRYQRPVGRVVCRGTDVGVHQVTNGLAWVFDQYADPKSLLYPLQAAAMSARRGLWADEMPMPPWEWRAAQRARRRDL